MIRILLALLLLATPAAAQPTSAFFGAWNAIPGTPGVQAVQRAANYTDGMAVNTHIGFNNTNYWFQRCQGYQAGTTLTLTGSNCNSGDIPGPMFVYSVSGGTFPADDLIVSGTYPTYTMNQSATVGSSGSPATFNLNPDLGAIADQIGTHLFRDTLPNSPTGISSSYYVSLYQNHGIKFIFQVPYDVYPSQYTLSNIKAVLDALETAAPGIVQGIEGCNECGTTTNFTYLTNATGLPSIVAFQEAMFSQTMADSQTSSIQVLSPSISQGDGTSIAYFQANYPGSTCALMANVGNFHLYYGTLGPNLSSHTAGNLGYCASGPVTYQTETGIATPTTVNPFNPFSSGNQTYNPPNVNEPSFIEELPAYVARVYRPNVFLVGWQGFNPGGSCSSSTVIGYANTIVPCQVITAVYEMLNSPYNNYPTSCSSPPHECDYGIAFADGSLTSGGQALACTYAVLKDLGPTARTFTPGTANIAITGLPPYNQSGIYNLFQRSDGTFVLAFAASPTMWTTSFTPVTPPTETVNVNLGANYTNVSVTDSTTCTTTAYSNVSSIPAYTMQNGNMVMVAFR